LICSLRIGTPSLSVLNKMEAGRCASLRLRRSRCDATPPRRPPAACRDLKHGFESMAAPGAYHRGGACRLAAAMCEDLVALLRIIFSMIAARSATRHRPVSRNIAAAAQVCTARNIRVAAAGSSPAHSFKFGHMPPPAGGLWTIESGAHAVAAQGCTSKTMTARRSARDLFAFESPAFRPPWATILP
jgi:hypothetical protein